MMAGMLQETIALLEKEVESAGVPPEKKAELQRLLATLRAEAARAEPRREQLELSVAGLRRSVREFERTHPRLVEAVGSLANSLSNVGL
jgi:uncharacterized protein involved in exopolysaccharide biosynthesis